jgi:uncharacterized protein YbbC (DUF1343 family)
LIEAFRNADRDRFGWRQPPYEYEHNKMPIDILYGSARLREGLDSGMKANELIGEWEVGIEEFLTVRTKFLLY